MGQDLTFTESGDFNFPFGHHFNLSVQLHIERIE
jgi:hypothetical protein